MKRMGLGENYFQNSWEKIIDILRLNMMVNIYDEGLFFYLSHVAYFQVYQSAWLSYFAPVINILNMSFLPSVRLSYLYWRNFWFKEDIHGECSWRGEKEEPTFTH